MLRSDDRHEAGRMQSGSMGRSVAAQMDEASIKSAYRRWAPVYDNTFGRFTTEGRRHAVEIINQRSGRVLEVGVGTGLSLPEYRRSSRSSASTSRPRCSKGRGRRSTRKASSNVTGLHEMDATELTFPTASFDTVVAMYVMTVVPDPEKVMRELARVCKVGGEVILVNHFSQEEGVRGWVERRMAPFADKLGWRPVFDVDRVMVCDNLKVVGRRALRPWGSVHDAAVREDPRSRGQAEAAE